LQSVWLLLFYYYPGTFAIVATGWLVACLLLLFILPLVDYFHFVDIIVHIFVLLLRSLSPLTRCCPQHDHHYCYYQRQLLRRRRILIFSDRWVMLWPLFVVAVLSSPVDGCRCRFCHHQLLLVVAAGWLFTPVDRC